MARYLSLYPSGAPGLGLLLLRCGVALALAAPFWAGGQASPTAIAAGTLTLALLTGLLCRAGAAAAAILLAMVGAGGDGSTLLLAASILEACSLALLGGGAYSLDAALFGRRTIDLPPRRPS